MMATQPATKLCRLVSRSVATRAMDHDTRRPVIQLVMLTLALLAGGQPALAEESLAQALKSAYRFNPALLAERKGLEATDEDVSQARAGFRPRVIGTADAGHQELRTNPASPGDGSTKPRGYTIQITQSLFQGFQTVNAVRQAEANVLAARESLRTVEQNTLLNAVTAYVDVIRDRAIVRLRENNVRVLTREKRATDARFTAGDVSRTDVAQSEARRAGAVSALDLAKSNLRTSEAIYQQVIGHMPGRLREPKLPQRNIPSSVQQGIQQAQQESPAVVQAAFLEKAATHNIDQLTGALLPTVDLEADYTNRFDTSAFTAQAETLTFTGRLNIPFYQGGGVYAQIRKARRLREQRGQQIENQRRIARANFITGWSSRRAAVAQLRSDRVQVRANRTALTGVRAEEDVGQRSILDVLDAEQELLDSQVSLVGTKRDLVVATYGILSAVGRLTAADIGLQVEQHDPEEYYGLVRQKPWGTRVLRDEAYEGFVVGEENETTRQSTHLAGDIVRMTSEARAWAMTEIRREDDFGRWDGEVIVEETETYK